MKRKFEFNQEVQSGNDRELERIVGELAVKIFNTAGADHEDYDYDRAFWACSEYEGFDGRMKSKYDRQRLWSVEAEKLYATPRKDRYKGLRHVRIVSPQIMKDQITGKSIEDIKAILRTCVAVVVTEDEFKRLSRGADGKRFQDAGIVIKDRLTGQLVIDYKNLHKLALSSRKALAHQAAI